MTPWTNTQSEHLSQQKRESDPARRRRKSGLHTGAARGQGRGHAIGRPWEGGDIIAVDIWGIDCLEASRTDADFMPRAAALIARFAEIASGLS